MRPESLGDVIATRKLVRLDDPSCEVLVRLGKPQESGHGDYFCPIQITGLGNGLIYGLYGIDAFQALQLAMKFIGHRLHALN